MIENNSAIQPIKDVFAGKPADAAMNVSFVDNASGHQYFSATLPPISLREHELREELHGKGGGGGGEDARARPMLACRDEQFFGMKLRAPLYATRARDHRRRRLELQLGSG